MLIIEKNYLQKKKKSYSSSKFEPKKKKTQLKIYKILA